MKKFGQKLLIAAIICLAIASFVILLMPIASDMMENNNNVMAYVIAAVFWIGTVAGYILFLKSRQELLLAKRKENRRSHKEVKSNKRKLPIANSRTGLVFNIILLISILGYILTQVAFSGPIILGFVFIFLFVLSFHMQIIFNSETFVINSDLFLRKVENDEE